MTSPHSEEKKEEPEYRINPHGIERNAGGKRSQRRSAAARIKVTDPDEFRRWEKLAAKLAQRRVHDK